MTQEAPPPAVEKDPGLSDGGKKWLEDPSATGATYEELMKGFWSFQEYYESVKNMAERAGIARKAFAPVLGEVEAYLARRDEVLAKGEKEPGYPMIITVKMEHLIPSTKLCSAMMNDIIEAHDLEKGK